MTLTATAIFTDQKVGKATLLREMVKPVNSTSKSLHKYSRSYQRNKTIKTKGVAQFRVVVDVLATAVDAFSNLRLKKHMHKENAARVSSLGRNFYSKIKSLLKFTWT